MALNQDQIFKVYFQFCFISRFEGFGTLNKFPRHYIFCFNSTLLFDIQLSLDQFNGQLVLLHDCSCNKRTLKRTLSVRKWTSQFTS